MTHRLAIVLLSLSACLGSAAPLGAQEDLGAEIDAAIDAGVKHIWSTQRDNGLFSDLDPRNPPRDSVSKPVYPGDAEVMAMAVLAYAGEPLEKPEMKKALKALLEIELEKTYTLSIRVIALSKLARDNPGHAAIMGLRAAIKRDCAKIIEIQHTHGGWHYGKGAAEKYWDFSNTQFAILALFDAIRAGIEIPTEPFVRTRKLYLEKQHGDGGWSYGRTGWDTEFSTGSMTAPGVASMFIIRDVLNPDQGCPCRSGKSAGRRDIRVDKAIDEGLTWLGENFTPSKNPPKWDHYLNYWLYAAQRVGQKTGLKYFGQHNWYAEGARRLLAKQRPNGSWGGFSNSAFAMLFLIKGRGPILLNKLTYDGPWDLHPNDVGNLAQFVGRTKEQHFNWQAVHLGVPVEELHDAPILYITAEEPIDLSDEHKKKLRRFTDTGGTILLEASCGNRAARTWIEKLCLELWPEWELKSVDRNHPLWTADIRVTGRPPVLKGLSDGIRTFLFFAPLDVSCRWHADASARGMSLFQMGNNLYAYSTDRARIRSRFAGRGDKRSAYTDQAASLTSDNKALTVARLPHGGSWSVGRNYSPWTVLGQHTAMVAGLKISQRDPLTAGQAIPADTGLVYLAGRGKTDLNENTRTALKAYLAAGGFLFVEAILGDKAFDASVRDELKAAGLELKVLGMTSSLLTGQLGGASGYKVTRVRTSRALTGERIGRPEPLVYGIYGGAELVGVYSPYDIMYSQTGCKAFDARGYAADDARALATNIALLAAAKRK